MATQGAEANRPAFEQRPLLLGILVLAMGAVMGRALAGPREVPPMPWLMPSPSARDAELRRDVDRMLEIRRRGEVRRANEADLLRPRRAMPRPLGSSPTAEYPVAGSATRSPLGSPG